MKRRINCLNTKIVLLLCVFLVFMILVFYLFQNVLLKQYYYENKKNDLITIGETIKENIQNINSNEQLADYAINNEACILIISRNAKKEEISENSNCVLSKINVYEINEIAKITNDNNNTALITNYKFKVGQEVQDVFIYSHLYEKNGISNLLLISSLILPLNSTIKTIQSQYLTIVSIMIVAVLLLAFLLTKIITKPLKQIEQEAVKLPLGKYSGDVIKSKITEITDLDKTLVKANEQINIADKAKKELIGNVSHDLKTPLTMITGFSDLMLNVDEELTRQNVEIIFNESKRLTELVEDLLDFSKIENGVMEINKSRFELKEFLDEIYESYRFTFEKNNVEFKLCNNINKKVEFDRLKIRQVINNFLNNALNYNDNTNPYIELGTKEVDDKIEVYVYDNGKGIKEEDLSNIWDRYYKVGDYHVRFQKGSGIGLSLSKNILEKHQFSFGVDSKYGEYSKFYFRF